MFRLLLSVTTYSGAAYAAADGTGVQRVAFPEPDAVCAEETDVESSCGDEDGAFIREKRTHYKLPPRSRCTRRLKPQSTGVSVFLMFPQVES